MKAAPAALVALCLLQASPAALAQLRAQVTATDPPSPAVLARDQPFFVRIEYAGADGHALWARPWHRGQPVTRAKFNASARHAGDGAALGWFSLDGAAAVDEVRIVAGGGKPFREFELLRLPVDVRGTGEPGARADRAAWVEALSREAADRHRQEMSEAMARPPSVADSLLGTGFMLAVLGLLAAAVIGPAWALRRWRGGWRVAGAVPLVAAAFVAGRIVLDTARDPTSHNLWPFEIAIVGGASAVYLGLLALARRFLARG